jgi:hypothetical protein
MDNNLEHNEWMDEAPHLARLPKVNPFAVPDQYFEGLSDRISAAVFVDDLKSEVGFVAPEVPEGYFELLTQEINSRITLEALKLTPEHGFDVPVGYFESLQGNIISKVSEVDTVAAKIEKPKVIRLWSTGFAKYAAAACLVLASAFAIFVNQDKLFSSNENVVATADAVPEDRTLWDVDEQAIRDEMQTEGAEQITNTSATAAEIEDYIISNYSQNEIASNL